MAYIQQCDRKAIEISPLWLCPADVPDELSFAILTLVERYLSNGGTMNGALAGVEAAKLEFFVKKFVPRNNQNKFDNGDI